MHHFNAHINVLFRPVQKHGLLIFTKFLVSFSAPTHFTSSGLWAKHGTWSQVYSKGALAPNE